MIFKVKNDEINMEKCTKKLLNLRKISEKFSEL